MNPFKRKALFTAVIAGIALALGGCAPTPKQLEAIGKSEAGTTACFYAKTMGFESTTVVTNAGNTKNSGLLQVSPTCGTTNARGQ